MEAAGFSRMLVPLNQTMWQSIPRGTVLIFVTVRASAVTRWSEFVHQWKDNLKLTVIKFFCPYFKHSTKILCSLSLQCGCDVK